MTARPCPLKSRARSRDVPHAIDFWNDASRVWNDRIREVAQVARVLVVEDDPRMFAAVRTVLLQGGYQVSVAIDGVDGLRLALHQPTDLVVLDIGLPKMDGMEVCRAIRQRSSVPILMLTGRSDELDKVLGLELGADDYLTKPFGMRELIARVRALLRRAEMAAGETTSIRSLKVGCLVLDLISRSAACDAQPLHLTPKEFDLLAFLVSNPGQVFSRQELLETVWGYDSSDTTRTVTVHVAELRRKLKAVSPERELIETVRGQGYRLGAAKTPDRAIVPHPRVSRCDAHDWPPSPQSHLIARALPSPISPSPNPHLSALFPTP